MAWSFAVCIVITDEFKPGAPLTPYGKFPTGVRKSRDGSVPEPADYFDEPPLLLNTSLRPWIASYCLNPAERRRKAPQMAFAA